MNAKKKRSHMAPFRGRTTMGKSHLSKSFKINVFKTHSLKIFNLAQQNSTKLLCRNCADNIKSIYRIRSYICYFLILINLNYIFRSK